MKRKCLALLLSALMLFAFMPAGVYAAEFSDVTDGSWYKEAVDFVQKNGLMNGLSDTSFAPNSPTTRGMVVTVLYRMAGSPAASTYTGFYDVPESEYYAGPIAWALYKKVATGYTSTSFGPGDAITREQMATFFYRFAAAQGYDTASRADLSKFTDAGDIHDYAYDAMSWANAVGLINGTTATTLDPSGNATRAQIAANLQRFRTKYPADKTTGTSDDLAAAIGKLITGTIGTNAEVSIAYDHATSANTVNDKDAGAAVTIAKDTDFYTVSNGKKTAAKVLEDEITLSVSTVSSPDATEKANAEKKVKAEIKDSLAKSANLTDGEVNTLFTADNTKSKVFNVRLRSIVDGEKNTEFHTLGTTTFIIDARETELVTNKTDSVSDYTFLAVHTNIDDKTEVVQGTVSKDEVSFKLNGLSTVYVYVIAPHTVKFINGNNSVLETKTVSFGANVSTPSTAPTRTGYKFSKWNETQLTKAKYQAQDVEAVWEDDGTTAKYTVTFDTNGGSTVTSQTVVDGSVAERPGNDPTKPEDDDYTYTFDDWYSDSGLTTKYDFSTAIKANTTIYAKWNQTAVTKYTVTFDFNGGTSAAPAQQTVKEGAKATKPEDPSKDSTTDAENNKTTTYTFAGWYANDSGADPFDFNTAITANVSLKAKWTETTSTSGDGSGSEGGSGSGGEGGSET